jgi:hypothetical protein
VNDSLDRLGADYPGWRVWIRDDGVYCGWRLGTSVFVRADAIPGLRQAIERETTSDEPA